MRAIFFRDLRSFFHTLTGTAFLAVFLLATGACFVRDVLVEASSSLVEMFSTMSVILIPMLPMLTMTCFAADRKTGTQQLLLSTPVITRELVLGKFLAPVAMLLVAMVVSFIYPGMILIYGKLSLAETFCIYMGFLMLGMAIISVGMFFSAICESSLAAYGLTVGTLFLLWLGNNVASYIPSAALRGLFTSISPFSSFASFASGLIRFSSIVTLLAFTFFFLFVTAYLIRRKVIVGRARP